MSEYVYVLSNPAMPDIIKVGRTNDVRQRIRNLSVPTGVPLPFECELVVEVDDAGLLERALHSVLDGSRLNPKREFFAVDMEDLRVVLTGCGTDVTDSHCGPHLSLEEAAAEDGEEETVEVQPITGIDVQAGNRWRRRRPKLNFDELGIPRGSKLRCTRDQTDGTPQIAIVSGAKRVLFDGNEMSLTRATQLARNTTYVVGPQPYWTFQGRTLQEISDEQYS